MRLYCPKCKKTCDFFEIDDGPDVAQDEPTYISYNCENCNIHLDGKNKNWYNGDEVSCYLHLIYAKPYMTKEEYKKFCLSEGV